MEQITNILYWLSTGLMIPVTLFLLFFFVRSLIMIGGFYGHYISRNKVNTKLNREIETETVESVIDKLSEYTVKNSALIAALERIKANQTKAIMLYKILGDYEIVADKELSKSKLLVKIGPMMIPTTVVANATCILLAIDDTSPVARPTNAGPIGMSVPIKPNIGVVGFITLQVRQRWVADDMNILEYVVESLKQK